MNKTTIALRFLMGAVVLGVGFAAGYMKRSPWIIAPLGLSFSVLYVLGKLRHWMQGYRRVGAWGMAKALPATVLVQIILAGLLYFVGLGFGYLIEPTGFIALFGRFDLIYSVAVLIGIGAVASLIALLERNLPDPIAAALDQFQTSFDDAWPHLLADLDVHPHPLKPETLFDGVARVHGDLGFDDAQQASQGDDEKIAAAEQRLGLRLPESLRAIYRFQNGGAINDVWAAASQDAAIDPAEIEHWIGVFPMDRDLLPTEHLLSLDKWLTAQSDDEMGETYPPDDASMLIVLSAYECKCLFLDYTISDEPRIGAADFEDPDWRDNAYYWPDFATFFALLRREDYEETDEATADS